MQLNDLIQINKPKAIPYAFIIALFIGILVFVQNDCFLYQRTIVRVTDV